MSFYHVYQTIRDDDFYPMHDQTSEKDMMTILHKNILTEDDFLRLLSPMAEMYLEQAAQKAHALSLQYFGKTVLLYTPMYLANYCVNRCVYCSFNTQNVIERRQLTYNEIEEEAKAIASTGLKHILILTGECRKTTPVAYIVNAVKRLKKYFDSVGMEIYPLTEEEYKTVINAGVDSLTVYQEVYDETIYDNVHLSGPKKDYKYRLDAPERACRQKIRSVNIGPLLGLNDWRKEIFFTGMHAKYLQKKYPDVDISISLPRIKPHAGTYEARYDVNDQDLVQALMALKLFLPRVGITISTREAPDFRDNLIPLGVVKMSAGVSTEVGGHALEHGSDSQFEISDPRNVNMIKHAILKKGYQPVFKDWMPF
ncbi:2-iminoacetate synthase ThiH [Vallitalea pronyensis]|uniref:2-iminoacetate synthase ThiH n=1 Tax=Vallitalea pronyensis TaxID=1348613 RepID=A0A8J8MKV3_9FIRM|nr:2-iminoacetate synthase ThiH [Vallitalea pronyensis]QUI23394.1 2-iminoacetate synthase ThiH [Vallitalea pronyensis]